jgi:tetratricopeptide (TPR) repeat protein
MEAPLDRSRASDRLKAAAQLEPRNPRILYLGALAALEKAPAGSAENRSAFEQLKRAVELFEASSATSDEAPGWGHAEAYLELGRQLQLRGDALAARNWIERSLIAAPDYKAAQRQLALLVRH